MSRTNQACALGVLRDDRIGIAAVIPEARAGDKLEMKKSQSPPIPPLNAA